ncbi:MAG: hypothetical protein JW820_07000, partial [Spirochaetales bacterium]|nr:hypothetical protein [Spirochaetales bacterium]
QEPAREPPQDAGPGRRPFSLVLEVSIAGVRLSAEDCQRMFGPFEQLSSAVEREPMAGVSGLALARRLAELLGGSAAAGYSEAEQATVLAVQVPAENDN